MQFAITISFIVLTYTHHVKHKKGYWDGEKMVIQTEEIIYMFKLEFNFKFLDNNKQWTQWK